MPEVELSAGTIEYEDTGGDGPVLVLLHGLAMDWTLWRDAIADLRHDHRCIAPTLPVGAHRRPMREDAALTPDSVAALVGELIDRLELRDATLVENDHAHAQRLVASRPDVAARLVLVSCEAFENYPPGLPGKLIGMAGRLPGGLFGVAQSLRWRALRRTPMALGWMAKRPIPDELTDRWFEPLIRRREIRRDLARYLRAVERGSLVGVSEGLRAFAGPALVVWAAEDRVMPREHGRRLAELIPDARHLEIPDSRTLVPLDQPAALAASIRDFVGDTPVRAESRRPHVNA